MENLQVIEHQEINGKEFTIYGTYDEPLFLAKDVAEWIGYSNVTDMVSRVDPDEVTKFNLGGLQGECNFLTEDGLYEVLMQSRKPIAKVFKKEVKQILKSVRKHGMYAKDDGNGFQVKGAKIGESDGSSKKAFDVSKATYSEMMQYLKENPDAKL